MAKTALEIFTQEGPRYFSIAPGRNFLNDLASGIRQAISPFDGLELSDTLIYLPTRRAVRALREVFVETAPDAKASLLPSIRALGDVDEDEFIAFQTEGVDDLSLPPAISSAERRIILAKLVAQRDKAFFDGQERWAGALSAGDELGKLLDSLYTEEIEGSALTSIVPDQFAHHWQKSLEFLSIVTEAWPNFLKESGLTDPADRRIQLIKMQAARWRENPPAKPVILAGTTGSTPAVAELMAAAASAPFGSVVLPGLDLDAPPHVWEAIDEPHPQSGLKALLGSLKIDRRDVSEWPVSGAPASPIKERAALFSLALRPADASDDWLEWSRAAATNKASLSSALDGVSLVEANDEENEAAAIAIKLRGAVEDPDTTAMLVTPDRDLGRRVSVALRRWDIGVDDSGGVPFANTRCGTYLRLVGAWLQDVSDPVALMAMLDHDLFSAGMEYGDFKTAHRQFDLLLRGVRPLTGIDGLRARIEQTDNLGEDAKTLLHALEKADAHWKNGGNDFAARFEAHLKIAEDLCQTPEFDGAARLWSGDDGETGAALAAQYRHVAPIIDNDQYSDYAAIFDQLIAGATVRRRRPTHPRIFIYGPLEARLQQADLVVLGGLNEGVWPRDAAIDPFLSRPMRKKLGLPSPERRMGLAAHDFMQLSSAPEIMLTRSTRSSGKPTEPSRWLVRLKNILTGADMLSMIDQTETYEAFAASLDKPEKEIRIPAPSPRPPADARPSEFFVTRFEKLMRDPYAIYARQILGLKKQDKLNEEFGPREIGNLLHKIFHEYVRGDGHDEKALWRLFEEHAPGHGLDETRLPFWRTRVADAFRWFATWDKERKALGSPAILEEIGSIEIKVGGDTYLISAKSDRIDELNDGSGYVIDYKTGNLPSLKQSKTFSPQLPLTGLILEDGGFENLGAVAVNGLEYIRTIGRKDDKKDHVIASSPECAEQIDKARSGVNKILTKFADGSTPYRSQPRPQFKDPYGDYDHLARRRERGVHGDAE